MPSPDFSKYRSFGFSSGGPDPSNKARRHKARGESVFQPKNSRATPSVSDRVAFSHESRCVNSDQCASGYACVGGGCVQQSPTGDRSGSVTGDGGCGAPPFTDPLYPVFPCGGAPSSGGPTCGNDNCYSTPPGGPGGDPTCGPDECCYFDEGQNAVICVPGAACPPLPPEPPEPGEEPTTEPEPGPLPEDPIVPIDCDTDSDCPDGLSCGGGQCVPTPCEVSADCAGGFDCTNNVCLPSTPTCPVGSSQSGSACVPDDCTTTCPTGSSCEEGQCLPDCDTDSDCPAGSECAGPVCVPSPCDEDYDCPFGSDCTGGQCLPGPCGPGFKWTPDGCVPDPFEPAPTPDPEFPEGTPENPWPDGGGGGGGGGTGDGDGNGDGTPGSLPGTPTSGQCNNYCDSYKKLFGESREGCGPATECDECTECKSSGQCGRPLLPSPNEPCWCEPGDCTKTDSCKECDMEPASSTYGDCKYGDDCQACARVYGNCCGETVSASACASLKTYGSFASTQANIWAYDKIDDCNKQCPDDPEACDCNCHNDCPECKLCGSDGKCYDDPSCTSNWVARYFYTVVTAIDGCRDSNCDPSSVNTTEVGLIQTRWSMADEIQDFDFNAAWVYYRTDIDNYADSCATTCGMPLPPYTVKYYRPGDNTGSGVPDQSHTSGGFGFNWQSATYYSFHSVTGYGETEQEARDDAISKIPYP